MCGATAPFPVCPFTASTGTTVPTLHYDGETGYNEDPSPCSNKYFNQLYFAQPPPCCCKTHITVIPSMYNFIKHLLHSNFTEKIVYVLPDSQ